MIYSEPRKVAARPVLRWFKRTGVLLFRAPVQFTVLWGASLLIMMGFEHVALGLTGLAAGAVRFACMITGVIAAMAVVVTVQNVSTGRTWGGWLDQAKAMPPLPDSLTAAPFLFIGGAVHFSFNSNLETEDLIMAAFTGPIFFMSVGGVFVVPLLLNRGCVPFGVLRQLSVKALAINRLGRGPFSQLVRWLLPCMVFYVLAGYFWWIGLGGIGVAMLVLLLAFLGVAYLDIFEGDDGLKEAHAELGVIDRAGRVGI